ncbi:hypothetical protein SJ05684_c27270 [Sinorhizobium sojae CCBAU 05684]|uniref:Uncharacterized protein n=1 Tax=Sinorhizobium sojae CCBAU 05684 TaxID=716928 RepID=A0A249PE18_9HYPH|nr:hypothetical protein SJ05684_c27270 [Sinorhizobium sojae CCBAU 05684]
MFWSGMHHEESRYQEISFEAKCGNCMAPEPKGSKVPGNSAASQDAEGDRR